MTVLARVGRSRLGGVALLLTLCGFFSALHWLKLTSLWGDPARWLFEAFRASRGEVVYLDFAWQFPPLAVWLMSGAFQLFGATFEVAQVVLAALGVINVFLLWAVARRLLTPGLALVTTAALTIALGTGIAPDSFWFSLQQYTPAQLTGQLGLMLLLIVLIDYVRTGRLSRGRWLAVSAGSTIGLLSKPEFALGVVIALIAVISVDKPLRFDQQPIGRWLRQSGRWLTAGIVPALLVYVVTGWRVGFDNLVAGLTGYGAAAYICPWWPTGISAFGVLTALGMGALWIAMLSLPSFNRWRVAHGRRYLALWLAAALGFIGAVIYLPALARQNGFGALTASDLARVVLAPGAILLPALWWSMVLWWRVARQVWMAYRHGTPLSIDLAVRFVLAAVVAALTVRGWFGDQNAITPLVAVAAMPLLFIVWVCWLRDSLTDFEMPNANQVGSGWSRVVISVLVVFGAARLCLWVWLDLPQSFQSLVTDAGLVYVGDTASVSVYDFLRTQTQPGESFLDVNYGGGLNFALRRGSPVFSTQWWYLAPPQTVLADDLARFQAQPPRYVVGNTLDYFGAAYGSIASTRCTFPRLVWRSAELAYDPAQSFPVLDEIVARYKPVAEFEGVMMYERRGLDSAP